MNTNLFKALSLIGLFSLVCGTNNYAQFGGITLPKPKAKDVVNSATKATSGSNSSSSGSNTTGTVKLGGSDASGLFSNVGDDPSADAHRKAAVSNLQAIEAEYGKTAIDYVSLGKLLKDTDQRLEFVKKLEPNCNTTKFVEKYSPWKDRGSKDLAKYDRVKELEKLIDKEFSAPTKYETYSPLTFRTKDYGAKDECYCRSYDTYTKTYAEYVTAKNEYDGLTKELVGYKDERSQTLFANMATCIQNGNQYAVWASKENLEKDVVQYNTANYALKPKDVISRCDKYTEGLGRIESDYSLSLDETAKAALAEARSKIAKIKADAETYISSGEYQKHLDKLHKEEIAKVFLPKAVTKNSTLEQGAINYIKGEEYSEYVGAEESVASTYRAVTLTVEPLVVKNEYDLPKWQYHEMWVSYKGKDGKCYRVAVYASYTYKGGGVYASTPTWGADAPQEMACENVNK